MPTAIEPKPAASSSSLPGRWLHLYGDSLYAYAIRRVRRPEAAEDLLQETLLAGVREYKTFTGRADVKTWLTGILKHKIADHLRARYRNEKIESCALEDDAMFTRHGRWKSPVVRWKNDPHGRLEQSELRSVLDGCMSKLPTHMAHLFLSRVVDETSTVDLCEELKISKDNAWALLHRARLRLRQCVTTNWLDDTSRQEN